MAKYLADTKALLSVGLPLILAQLAQTSLGFIDTLMVGRLGSAELAGIALGSTIWHFTLIVLAGVVQAVGPIVAQAFGARQEADAGRAVRQGLWLATGLSVLAIAFFWGARPLLLAMGQEPETVALSSSYLRAISYGFIFALWTVALRGFLEGVADTRPIMVFGFMGIGLNVLANNALMFGRWGLPALGLVGTGYASSIVFFGVFVATLSYVLRYYQRHRIFQSLRLPDMSMLKELLRIGVPIGLTLGFETSMFAAVALLMGVLGAVPLAAHQIAIQTASFTFMVPLGLSLATAVLVGQSAGRRDYPRVRRLGVIGTLLTLGFMCLTAMTFWGFPRAIIGLYLDVHDSANAAVVQLASQFLAVAAMFQLFDGLQVSAVGALRGMKDTRAPMMITLLAYWGLGIPCALWFAFGLGLAGQGLWFGLVVGLAVAGILLLVRFWLRVRAQLKGRYALSETQSHPSYPFGR
jgi:MATE family multidrug resistance protein